MPTHLVNLQLFGKSKAKNGNKGGGQLLCEIGKFYDEQEYSSPGQNAIALDAYLSLHPNPKTNIAPLQASVGTNKNRVTAQPHHRSGRGDGYDED
jgi:hypothetical protein